MRNSFVVNSPSVSSHNWIFNQNLLLFREEGDSAKSMDETINKEPTRSLNELRRGASAKFDNGRLNYSSICALMNEKICGVHVLPHFRPNLQNYVISLSKL